MQLNSGGKKRQRGWQRIVIAILASFLISYHLTKKSSLYIVGSGESVSTMGHIQTLIRLAIACTLFFFAVGSSKAIWGMWVTILALVATQYIGLAQPLDYSHLAMSANFTYLKGFIATSVITLLHAASSPSPTISGEVRESPEK